MSATEEKDDRNDPLAGPSIDQATGKLLRVSPSQIKTFEDCPRKWWYDKAAKQKRKPPSKGQLTGSRGHKILENFLTLGIDQRGPLENSGAYMLEPLIPYSPFEVSGKFLYPTAKSEDHFKELVKIACDAAPLKVEESINFDRANPIKTPGGVLFIGYSDLFLAPGFLAEDLSPGGNIAHVMDHKFKKKLEQYADTEAQIKKDAQKKVYGFSALMRWPTASGVRFAHHNHQTEGAKHAFPRETFTPADEVRREFEALCVTVDRDMADAATRLKDLDVKPVETSCDKFGGCDFAAFCPNSPRNRFLGAIPGVTRPGITIERKKDTMGLLDMAQNAQRAAAASAAQAPAGAPATLPGVPVTNFPAAGLPGVMAPAPALAPVQPAPVQAPPPSQVPASQNPATASDFIAAGNATPGQIYAAGKQFGKFVGRMAGGLSIFTNAQGGMYQVNDNDPVRSMMNDPNALAAFGLAPAPAAPAFVPAPVQTVPGVTTLPRTGHQIVDVPGVPAGAAINPPNVAAATAPLVGDPAQLAAYNAQLAAQQAAALGQPATVPAPTGTTPAAEPDKKPGKRGRPRKTTEAIANGTAQAEANGGIGGLILVVDAAVLGENVTDLSGYVADLAEALAKANNAPDVRFADPKGPLGFGAWRGALAAAARASAPSGLCSISSGELNDPVIEALAPLADAVIRG